MLTKIVEHEISSFFWLDVLATRVSFIDKPKEEKAKMFEAEMLENIAQMKLSLEQHLKLVNKVVMESLTETFGDLTEKQQKMVTECAALERAISACDTLTSLNDLLTDIRDGKVTTIETYSEEI